MSPSALPPLGELLQFPFMQRALLAGLLSGSLGGLLGSFTVLRQLSFFSDALGHSALLGISLGLLLGLNPTLVLIPFAVGFALLVARLVERSRLPTDALLNVVYSSALAIAVVVLTALPGQRGRLEQLLFGDILAVGWSDLALLAFLLALALLYLVATRRSQILLTLDPGLATARGVAVGGQRLGFMVVLAVVVALSIKAVGVLLISAFLVIPACAARQISGGFGAYLWLSTFTGGGCGLLGILASGLLNLPSGPCVVIMQLVAFVLALLLSSRGGAAG
jgi:zinc/manganese transport system permease protein